MLKTQTGSFLGGGGMLREGLLHMAEEITLWAGMALLSSEKKKKRVVLTRFSIIL